MVYIVKNGVVNVSFGKENPDLGPIIKQRGFDPEKIRDLEFHSNVIIQKKIENPGFKAYNDKINFHKNDTKMSNYANGNSDLQTIPNLINNNHENIMKDRTVSIYLKKDKPLENPNFNLVNNNFYDTKQSSFQNLGNFEKNKVIQIRKIDTDNSGIKFDYSVKGFKHVESRELFNHPVPIVKNMNAIHTPISLISNGTKQTYKSKS